MHACSEGTSELFYRLGRGNNDSLCRGTERTVINLAKGPEGGGIVLDRREVGGIWLETRHMIQRIPA